MASKLVLGPILGITSDTEYSWLVMTKPNVNQLDLVLNGNAVVFTKLGELTSGWVWRASAALPLTPNGTTHDYQVQLDGELASSAAGKSSWQFYQPGATEEPRMAYCSCNGFSDYKLLTSTETPYALWSKMQKLHGESPFSLLLMGGDQLYADSIWTQVTSLKSWNEQPRDKKVKAQASKVMQQQIANFYGNLYVDRWNKQPFADMLASIPSVMMWDDHDIFDGWGSYPADIQNCEVYQAIYQEAKRHFELLQLRGTDNPSLIPVNGARTHFTTLLKFRKLNILALDNRSERTIKQVMGAAHWADVIASLATITSGDLLLMSAVPVVYRDFSFAESAVDATPWEEELTDDLKDHWRAKEHEGERSRLIMRLLENARMREGKTVILSGDVHVGALGVIRAECQQQPVQIHQIVSSGIVHPAPSFMQWLGITAVTNDDVEYLDEAKKISASMIKPFGGDKYLRCRNFTTLQAGTDGKLWVNWIIEGKDEPVYPIQ
ncbi:alkaline phosphatase D family protein [Pseudoalteromonas fenneropenaei]|uniref:Alkaline phosphatase D family protein n=1 Tax=Pseudoalteromonas fenneropenaei TaxID=1737459 RepID=A0ABV7CMX9_9GAMM